MQASKLCRCSICAGVCRCSPTCGFHHCKRKQQRKCCSRLHLQGSRPAAATHCYQDDVEASNTSVQRATSALREGLLGWCSSQPTSQKASGQACAGALQHFVRGGLQPMCTVASIIHGLQAKTLVKVLQAQLTMQSVEASSPCAASMLEM